MNIYKVPGNKAQEMYSEHNRTSTMEIFTEIVKNLYPLTILARSSILHARLSSEYASGTLSLSRKKRFAISSMVKSSTSLTAKMVCVHDECK